MKNLRFLLLFLTGILAISCVNRELESTGLNQYDDPVKDELLQFIDTVQQLAYAFPDSAKSLLSGYMLKRNFAPGTIESATITHMFGVIHYIKNEYKPALDSLFKAWKLFNTFDDSLRVCSSHITIGAVFMLQGLLDSAQVRVMKGLEIAEKFNKSSHIAKACINLSGIHYYLDNKPLALLYARKALREGIKLNSPMIKNRALINIGIVLSDLGKIDAARDTLLMGLEIARKTREIQVFSDGLNRLGLLELKEGNPRKALDYYDELLTFSSRQQDEFIMSEALSHLAIVYDTLGNYEMALKYGRESYELAQKTGSISMMAYSTALLAQLHEKTGGYQESNYYLKKNISLNDSILNEKKNKQVLELETRYQTAKARQENQQLRFEKKADELKLSRNRIILISVISLVVLLIIVGIIIFRLDQLRTRQNEFELEQKLFRSQLNPHFIFNSLASIQSYIITNQPEEAVNYLSDFARLMRLILENSTHELISLDKELETIRFYLRLEKMRHEDKFNYSIEIDESRLWPGEVEIPPMLAQPFLENAIIHGLKDKENNGIIKVSFSEKNDNLILKIQDNGVGRHANSAKNISDHTSFATSATSRRMENLQKKYRKNFSISIHDLHDNGQPAGTLVEFCLPMYYNSK